MKKEDISATELIFKNADIIRQNHKAVRNAENLHQLAESFAMHNQIAKSFSKTLNRADLAELASAQKILNVVEPSFINATIGIGKLHKDVTSSIDVNAFETIANLGNYIKAFHENIKLISMPAVKGFEAVGQYGEALNAFAYVDSNWTKVFAPAHSFYADYFDALEKIDENIKRIIKRTRKVIDILAKNQYVIWLPLSIEQENDILKTKDIDNILLEIETKNDDKKINNTIDVCIKCGLLQNHQFQFEQAIGAYRRNEYNIVITAMLPILDSLLSRYSGQIGTNMNRRMEKIIKKFKLNEIPEDEYIAWSILDETLTTAIETLTEVIKFDKNEPQTLNRHWIIHGRSKRKISQLDCIKIINCICAVFFISTLKTEQ